MCFSVVNVILKPRIYSVQNFFFLISLQLWGHHLIILDTKMWKQQQQKRFWPNGNITSQMWAVYGMISKCVWLCCFQNATAKCQNKEREREGKEEGERERGGCSERREAGERKGARTHFYSNRGWQDAANLWWADTVSSSKRGTLGAGTLDLKGKVVTRKAITWKRKWDTKYPPSNGDYF